MPHLLLKSIRELKVTASAHPDFVTELYDIYRLYKHYRVHPEAGEFVERTSHNNEIESFWSYAKRRLAQFNGIPKKKFVLYFERN